MPQSTFSGIRSSNFRSEASGNFYTSGIYFILFYFYFSNHYIGEAKKYQSSFNLVSNNQFYLQLFVAPSLPLYSYFYPKVAVFPKFKIITILCSRDM